MIHRERSRLDEPCNLLCLCLWPCHQCAELDGQVVDNERPGEYWPKLPLAVCLTLKQEVDPENYNPARLAEIMGRKSLPSPAELPERFLQERERNGV